MARDLWDRADKYYLISFLIHITEIFRVKLNIVNSANENYLIYDGPGHIFDILSTHSKKSTYIASTFQCLLKFFTPYLIPTVRHHIDFNMYFPDKSTIHRYIKTYSEILIHIPLSNCQQNWCNIFLQTNLQGSQLNF